MAKCTRRPVFVSISVPPLYYTTTAASGLCQTLLDDCALASEAKESAITIAEVEEAAE